MAILFVRLIACCVAIGLVLTSDVAIVKQLIKADPKDRLDPEHLSQLHKYVLPMLQKAGSLLKLSFSQRILALITGAVSGVSWFYAAMLGIGRPLNFKYSLFEILAAYPMLIAGGFVAMVLLTAWAQYQASGEAGAFEGTRLMGS